MPDAPSPCPSWPLRLTLRDGRQVTVRPIRGEDSSAVVEAFKGLSVLVGLMVSIGASGVVSVRSNAAMASRMCTGVTPSGKIAENASL